MNISGPADYMGAKAVARHRPQEKDAQAGPPSSTA